MQKFTFFFIIHFFWVYIIVEANCIGTIISFKLSVGECSWGMGMKPSALL